MGFFDLFTSKRKDVTSTDMIILADKWAKDYVANYRVKSLGVIEHEIYMFCGWIVWNYMLNNSYLPSDAKEMYLSFIHEKVKKVKLLSKDQFISFYSKRIKMYKYEMNRLRSSEKPYLMESLYGALYKTMFLDENTYYDCSLYNEFGELCEFMDNFVDFWNKVNKELLNKYKPKR